MYIFTVFTVFHINCIRSYEFLVANSNSSNSCRLSVSQSLSKEQNFYHGVPKGPPVTTQNKGIIFILYII